MAEKRPNYKDKKRANRRKEVVIEVRKHASISLTANN